MAGLEFKSGGFVSHHQDIMAIEGLKRVSRIVQIVYEILQAKNSKYEVLGAHLMRSMWG
jgi:hypothetical protein